LHDVLAHDVFTEAGVAAAVDKDPSPPQLVMLREQFRMDDVICRTVSSTFYDGKLVTSPDRTPQPVTLPSPFAARVTIVDTSRVWPFTTRNAFNSRLNLMHALAARNIVLHLQNHGGLLDEQGKGSVGLCTPYAAQAKLLRAVVKAYQLEKEVRASTIHRFQGDERRTMVLDLVDSVGEHNVGVFLQAEHRNDSGAKLLNVALSRAKQSLIIIANLTYLDAKLPGTAILRDVLHDLQRTGCIVDVRDVLALRPIADDLEGIGRPPDLDPETLRTGLFNGHNFARLARKDMEGAKHSIIIFSGFITSERVAQMGDLLRGKIARGVRVRCVTRPPRRNGQIPEENARSALRALEAIGVAVDLRNEIHEKVLLVDNRVTWFGSLNPLSHTAHTSELMARVVNEDMASHMANFLALRRRVPENFADAENPRCGKCNNWSVFVRGTRKYGPFFGCEAECGWKQNL
jgi:hypothetical protein